MPEQVITLESLINLDAPFLPYHVAEFIRRSYLYQSLWSLEQEALFHAIPPPIWSQLEIYISALSHDLNFRAKELEEGWSWNIFDRKVRESWKMGERLKVERSRMSEVMNTSGWFWASVPEPGSAPGSVSRVGPTILLLTTADLIQH
ncbi:BZ3500_MvSof-1268-A1-R1_Chr1-3g01861 [Microbotryum saponariae]|uniref:BZ3500_MvSof-1268-A1-R1_Chr1-3g01861 protein n=1 Tax=Microbotryum saponariae TaxID=289078 RepID=A0A2X0LFH3_9BASI|nr:BZ3500_MvSof-1268-A1-R1_Chr1-3g01861 [Microbotryum saponariae]SCZ94753.1 BZ3501_MvSof-1269-A2-R1_Chr1-3g01463 [Microbotryum saponariae]